MGTSLCWGPGLRSSQWLVTFKNSLLNSLFRGWRSRISSQAVVVWLFFVWFTQNLEGNRSTEKMERSYTYIACKWSNPSYPLQSGQVSKKPRLSKSLGVKVALFILYLLPRHLPCKKVWQWLLISVVIHTSGGGGNLKGFSPLWLNNHTFLLLSLTFPSSRSWVHRRHQPFV